MEEEWRPVVGWEGLYEVSDLGRVRSIPRLGAGGGGSMRMRGGQILKRSIENGRARVRLCDRERIVRKRVYVLVAEAFLGPRPPGHDVRHLDDVATNDVLTNLAYGTRAENIEDAERNGKTWYVPGQCRRGHLKEGRNNWRGQCYSCILAGGKAWRARQRGITLNVDELADEYYTKLIGETK